MEQLEEKGNAAENTCSFGGIRPATVDLPYPPLKVREKNQAYANLLGIDYCGSVSELTAIAQYINHENRLSLGDCAAARVLLGIAMAEMLHLQMLGQMAALLGGTVDFTARCRDGRQKLWTAENAVLGEDRARMLSADLEGERSAITQYRMHVKLIGDPDVRAVLERIIRDEEYHITLLQALARG